MPDPVEPASRADTTVRLRPRPAAAAWWAALATVLTAAGVFFVVDSDGHALAWAMLAVAVLIAAWYLGQLLVPSSVSLDLTESSMRARTLLWVREVPWEAIHLARVRRIAGDPVLTLDVRDAAPPGGRYRTVNVVLPIGCELEALHAVLEQRLGRGPLRPPTEVRPLEL